MPKKKRRLRGIEPRKDYNLVKAGHECTSADTYLGPTTSVQECADRCKESSGGCKFFIYGTGSDSSDAESDEEGDKADDVAQDRGLPAGGSSSPVPVDDSEPEPADSEEDSDDG